MSALGKRVAANLGDERGKLPRRLGLGVGLHRAMQPAHPPVGVATGRDRELPHAWADLGSRSRASWSSPPVGRRGLATQGEVLDPHARLVVRARLDDDTGSECAARQLPRNAPRRDGLAINLQLPCAVASPRPRPDVVLAGTIDLRLETVPQALTHRASPTCRGVSERCNRRCKAPQVLRVAFLTPGRRPRRPWSAL
jgi:hypothetical protein